MHDEPNRESVYSHHGTVRDVFGHRFVLTTVDGPVLADVGPHAPAAVKLKPGARVKISGQRTPCEIKVSIFQSGSGKPVEIPRKPNKTGRHKEGGMVAAKAALDAGYIVEGEPVRKSKHFELMAIRGGRRYELHIRPNGDIRKEKLRPKKD